MDHAQTLPHHSFPWRTATLVVAAIAGIELVVLIGVGAAHFAKPHKATGAKAAPTHRIAARRPAAHVATPPSHPLRPRGKVGVLVLNGNGVQGAAATEASNLRTLGWAVGGAQNAPRHDYARSMIMYVPGYLKDARRLAADTGIRLVAPIDGLRPRQLKGSTLVVLLGS